MKIVLNWKIKSDKQKFMILSNTNYRPIKYKHAATNVLTESIFLHHMILKTISNVEVMQNVI